MTKAGRTLLALALLARPLAAAEPPFATELTAGIAVEGSAADRPVVVLDGVPSASYGYEARARGQALEVAATRWRDPVLDDGWTPFALLPWAARASSVSARLAVAGASRDSLGTFEGQQSALEVSFAGDGSSREADLAAEWFAGESLSVRGAVSYGSERETAASTSVERPSGRADVSTSATRASTRAGSLGVALRLGEHEVSLAGRYGATDGTRDDASAFTGSAQPFFSSLSTGTLAREATLAGRLLFLDRRLDLTASGSYRLSTSSSDLSTALSGPFAKGRAIARSLSAEATWYATRRLGVSLGLGYATRDVSSGSPGRLRPSSGVTERAFRAGVTWFASGRVSASLSLERLETDTVSPPGSTTYQKFEETTDRALLAAALRL